MLTIIFAPPRYGKTSFMTFLLNQRAFDVVRNKAMRKEIEERNAGGFNLTVPTYSVATNYEAFFRQFRRSVRPSTVINPYQLGFWNPDVETIFLPPYTTVGITEAQKYFNSRRFKEYPEWQSRFYEAHGHNHYDFFLDTQRPMLIDVNIRELSNFIEIVEMKVDRRGFCEWRIRTIDNSSLFDAYMASGKRDKSTYKETVVKADCDVFRLYDSRNLKPLFYAGHFNSDYTFNPAVVNDGSISYYRYYVRTHLTEVPSRFYRK